VPGCVAINVKRAFVALVQLGRGFSPWNWNGLGKTGPITSVVLNPKLLYMTCQPELILGA